MADPKKEEEKTHTKHKLEDIITTDHFSDNGSINEYIASTLNDTKAKLNSILMNDKLTSENKRNTKNYLGIVNHAVKALDKSAPYSISNYSEVLRNINDRSAKTDSGVRSIFENGLSEHETKIAGMYGESISNIFNKMHEYRLAIDMIPELSKIIKIVARDVININDIHKNIFMNVIYNGTMRAKLSENSIDISEEELKELESEFVEKVIKQNRLEDLIPITVEESLKVGARPIMVLPYSDILKMIEFDNKNDFGTSREALNEYDKRCVGSSEDYFVKLFPSSTESLFNIKGAEDDKVDRTKERMYANDILKNGKLVKRYMEIDRDAIVRGLEGYRTEENANEVDKALQDLRKDSTLDELSTRGQKVFLDFIKDLDENIEFVDPSANALYQGRKTLQKNFKFYRYKDFKDSVVVSDIKVKHKRTDTNESDSEFKKNKLSNSEGDIARTDDVLVIPLEADRVIPVTANGKHIAYYVIETDSYESPNDRVSKTSYSFLDVVNNSGCYNDDVVMNGSSIPSMIMGANDNISGIDGIGGAMNNQFMDYTMGEKDAKDRIDILRSIMMNTIATKADDMSVVENKEFRDIIMKLLYSGYIIDRKIRISYVPISNLIYFSNELDSNGLPVPFYSGCLFPIYLYVSSLTSSLMIKLQKSSFRDKITYSVGLDKQLNMNTRELEKNLTSRSIRTGALFSDGLYNILKNVASFETIYIPKVDGQELFDYEDMQAVNDLSIDDSFTDKLLEQTVSKSVPPSLLNKLDEDEYSRSILSQNMNYRRDIIAKQKPTGENVTKLLKIIARYTKFDNPKMKEIIKLIDFEFIVPNQLNIANMNNLLSEIDTIKDNVIRVVWGVDADEERLKGAIDIFTRNLLISLSPEIDWNGFFDEKEAILKDNPRTKLEEQKATKLATLEENIKNSEVEETGEGGGDFGGGGDYGGGDDGDGGDDEGGDDDGGGDLDF